jgi:hypothetical protein
LRGLASPHVTISFMAFPFPKPNLTAKTTANDANNE